MRNPVEFVKEAYYEFKRVNFPTKPELIRLTGFVIGVSLATGLFVTAFDFIFKEGISRILG